MQYNIGFYVHHHGSGHIMRCLSIAKALQNHNIFLFGSNLHQFSSAIDANITCYHLPMDVLPEGRTVPAGTGELTSLHYAPLNIPGQRERVAIMANAFAAHSPLLLIIDVSVEAAMLASLCGIPYIYIRQHGFRSDLPHETAYKNAQSVIAPYAEEMEAEADSWLKRKTFYSGCFSRYSNRGHEYEPGSKNYALIIIGGGGTSITGKVIKYIAESAPSWQFGILGAVPSVESKSQILTGNVEFYGKSLDVAPFLQKASVVIGNTGHNTVMEVATFKKPFVTIPEHRPFKEQAQKAEVLSKLGLATVIYPGKLFDISWEQILNNTLKSTPLWSRYTDDTAILKIAGHIKEVYHSVYG